MFDCTVLIATCNRDRMISACVESLVTQSCLPVDIFILDQSDGYKTETVCKKYSCVTYFRLPEKNKAKAINLGTSKAKTNFIAVIDDDCCADKDWLQRLSTFFLDNQTAYIITGRVIAGEIESGAVKSRLNDELKKTKLYRKGFITPIFILSGCNFCFRISVVSEIGNFDEEFGPGSLYLSSDDNEWAYRALTRGFEIFYVPSAVVYHRSWRSPQEDTQHMKTYGFAAGAFLAKVSKISKFDFFVHSLLLLRWLCFDMLRNILNFRNITPYTNYFLGYVRGYKSFIENSKSKIDSNILDRM